jgi:hypothetical protein
MGGTRCSRAGSQNRGGHFNVGERDQLMLRVATVGATRQLNFLARPLPLSMSVE